MMCPEAEISRTVTVLHWAASHMGITEEYAWQGDLSEKYFIYGTMIGDSLKQREGQLMREQVPYLSSRAK